MSKMRISMVMAKEKGERRDGIESISGVKEGGATLALPNRYIVNKIVQARQRDLVAILC